MSKEQHTSNETMAAEIIEDLKHRNFKTVNLLEDLKETLGRIKMALSMIKSEYEYQEAPSITGAYKAFTSKPGEYTEQDMRSYAYIDGYKEIMFLINVAFDYCAMAEKECSQEVCE